MEDGSACRGKRGAGAGFQELPVRFVLSGMSDARLWCILADGARHLEVGSAAGGVFVAGSLAGDLPFLGVYWQEETLILGVPRRTKLELGLNASVQSANSQPVSTRAAAILGFHRRGNILIKTCFANFTDIAQGILLLIARLMAAQP